MLLGQYAGKYFVDKDVETFKIKTIVTTNIFNFIIN